MFHCQFAQIVPAEEQYADKSYI